jgi:sporulation protein YlmC with PRC-barrel domain
MKIMKTSHLFGLALATALAGAPAMAQTTTAPGNNNSGTTAPGSGDTPAVGNTAPTTAAPGTSGGMADSVASSSSHNPVLSESGDIRASKVIGSSVYNDKNEKLGSVDEIIVGKDQKATQAVISVGGVLGIGAKLVAVPYDKLKFPEMIDSNTSRVMLPGTTADALNGMPTFSYASK